MKRLEPYLQPQTAAGFIIIFLGLGLIYILLNIFFSEGSFISRAGLLFIKILFVLMKVFIWLTLGKFMRDELKINYLDLLIGTIVSLILFNLFLVETGLSNLIPSWITMTIAISKALAFLIFGFLFISIPDYEIPKKAEFSITLVVIHISAIGFLIFNDYPWHGVELALSIFHFSTQAILGYFLYKIMIWAAKFKTGYSPLEKLIQEIGN